MICIKLLIVIFVICFHLSSVASIDCIFCRGERNCIVNPPSQPRECKVQPTWRSRKCILVLPDNRKLKDFRRDCLVSTGSLKDGCKHYNKEEVINLQTPAVLCTCGSKGCNGKKYREDGEGWPVGGGGELIENKNETATEDDDDDDGGAFIGPQAQPITILILTSILICLLAKIMDN